MHGYDKAAKRVFGFNLCKSPTAVIVNYERADHSRLELNPLMQLWLEKRSVFPQLCGGPVNAVHQLFWIYLAIKNRIAKSKNGNGRKWESKYYSRTPLIWPQWPLPKMTFLLTLTGHLGRQFSDYNVRFYVLNCILEHITNKQFFPV